jgi:hypothetical protein
MAIVTRKECGIPPTPEGCGYPAANFHDANHLFLLYGAQIEEKVLEEEGGKKNAF